MRYGTELAEMLKDMAADMGFTLTDPEKLARFVEIGNRPQPETVDVPFVEVEAEKEPWEVEFMLPEPSPAR